MAAVTRASALLLAIAVALAASLAPAGIARAQEADLDEARRLYAELDFQGAAAAAQRALEVPGARDLDRARALELLGCALVVLDREEGARDAFDRLFRIDPHWIVREQSGSPRIRRVFEGVRARIAPDAAIDPEASLRLEAPRAGRIGRAIELRAIADGGAIARVVVRVRGEGEAGWSELEGRREGDAFAITIPARSESEELELYAEGRDARGRVVTRAGGPLEPERIPVRPGEGGGSIVEEPWLWIGIGGGVVVVAAIVIGIAVAGPERAPPGTLPPNRVELPLVTF